jgi:hypothetical protein
VTAINAVDDELNTSTFQTYIYLVKVGKAVGPRDVMLGANLSSPSVAYRNLQKLIDSGLVVKDPYNNYLVKKKINLKGYLWVGKNLVPSVAIFGIVFVGVLVTELVILIPHLLTGYSIQESYWFLIVVTIISAALFLFQAVRFRKRPKTLS